MFAQLEKRPIGLIPHNYLVIDINLFKNKKIFVVVYVLIIFRLLLKESYQGAQSPTGYIHWVFFSRPKNVGDIFIFVEYCF